MATAARTAPNFEITAAPDSMDLHSDSGLDFGDADGDLDLDLQSPLRQDDDVSLQDAGMDSGFEVPAASGDHDDFMADNDDLIEEDALAYNDDVVIDVELQYMGDNEAVQETNMEEDLIDYSDDEEQPTWNEPDHPSALADGAEGSIVTNKQEHEQTVSHVPTEVIESTTHARSPQQYAHGSSFAQESIDDPSQTWNVDAVDDSESHRGDEQQEIVVQEHEDILHTAQLPEDKQVHEHGSPQYPPDVSSISHGDATLQEQVVQPQQEVFLHQVTVNYDSAELWLFKHHDYEGSGDYLVEDASLANKPLSSLLDACRGALGSDVTDDMELGFRLDNFHSIELYQEHSACAFVTIEHIVGLYLQLHAQDGVTAPESFYMTLLFRPRVSALLNEFSKAAAEGIGHSGLSKAINAGLTAFNAQVSHNSTENDDETDEQQHESGPIHNDVEDKLAENVGDDHNGVEDLIGGSGNKENEEQHEVNGDDVADNAEQANAEASKDAIFVPITDSSDDVSSGTDFIIPVDKEEVALNATLADRSHSNSAYASPTQEQEEDDLIDYSDDEGDAEKGQADEPSASSSTVQGDETAYIQDNAENIFQDSTNVEYFADESVEAALDQDIVAVDESFAQHDNLEHDLATHHDQAYDEEYNEANNQIYEGFEETQEIEGYPAEYSLEANDDNTNYLETFDNDTVDYPADVSTIEAGNAEHDSFQSRTIDDIFDRDDDAAEFASAVPTEDASINEQIGGDQPSHDDEGGADSQALVAASAVVDAVVTSSSALENQSPQGQKRTIDEVGNAVDDALDPTDAKRPRV